MARVEKGKGNVPCFCIKDKNLTMTLDEGRIKTWRLPRFSALLMLLRQSFKTEIRTIFDDVSELIVKRKRKPKLVAKRKGEGGVNTRVSHMSVTSILSQVCLLYLFTKTGGTRVATSDGGIHKEDTVGPKVQRPATYH